MNNMKYMYITCKEECSILPTSFYVLLGVIACAGMLVSYNVYLGNKRIADMHDEIADLRALHMELHDYINPDYFPFDEEEYVSDTHPHEEVADGHAHTETPHIEPTHSLEQNVALNERVARLKDDLSRIQHSLPRVKPAPALPLHPDVYNLPADDVPDTSHTVEYVK